MMNRSWRAGLGLIVGLALLIQAGGAWAEKDTVPVAVFPELKYDFDTIDEGVEIKHDFIVENQGRAPLEIKKVQPD